MPRNCEMVTSAKRYLWSHSQLGRQIGRLSAKVPVGHLPALSRGLLCFRILTFKVRLSPFLTDMLGVGRPVGGVLWAIHLCLLRPFLPQSSETTGLVGSFSALLELFLVFFFVNKPQVGSIDSRTLGGEAVTGKCGDYCVHACFI